jgi:hypothetical protein
MIHYLLFPLVKYIRRPNPGHRADQCKAPKRERAHKMEDGDIPSVAMITDFGVHSRGKHCGTNYRVVC